MVMMPLVICAVLVLIDQGIKYITVTGLKPVGSIEIVEGFFSLTYVENRGAAFGMLEGGRWLFIILTVVVCILCCVYYVKLLNENRLFIVRCGIVSVVGGAIGNLIDRLFRNYVVDMFDFNIFGYNYPVFNFADICVCVGAFLLVVGILFFDREEKK